VLIGSIGFCLLARGYSSTIDLLLFNADVVKGFADAEAYKSA
jgi:hypothetical protein